MRVWFASVNRLVTQNIAWLLVDRAGRLLLGFFVSVWIARQLGPELFGTLGYAQAAAGMLGFLGLAAIEAIVVRMLVDEPASANQILGSALLVRMIGGVATVLASILLMRILGVTGALALLMPLIAAATFFQALDVAEYWLRRRLQSKYGVLARLLALLIGAGLRMLAAASAAPLTALGMVILFESVLIAIGMTLALRAAGTSAWGWRPSRRRALDILSQAMPIFLSAIAVAIYVRFGFVFLGRTAGTAAVGLLSVATVITEALHALPVAVAASYGPIVLSNRLASPRIFDREIARLLCMAATAGLALSALVSAAAPALVETVFGEAYAESGAVLRVLVWSIVFVYLSVASELWFIGHGLQRYLLPKTAFAAAIFMALAVALIPRYGAMGAAVATLVTYSFSAFWSNLLFSRTRPLFFHQARALLLRSG